MGRIGCSDKKTWHWLFRCAMMSKEARELGAMLVLGERKSELNIYIICVGKIKERYLREGLEEYRKRLSAYAKIEVREVDDERAPENLSEKEAEQIKRKEGERILSALPKSSYVIALAIEGKMLSSEHLAEHIEELGVLGKSDISFVIGGSLGLSDTVLSEADMKLSFSKMTFPHQLMRLILTEQIYRAFRIIKGQPYHK